MEGSNDNKCQRKDITEEVTLLEEKLAKLNLNPEKSQDSSSGVRTEVAPSLQNDIRTSLKNISAALEEASPNLSDRVHDTLKAPLLLQMKGTSSDLNDQDLSSLLSYLKLLSETDVPQNLKQTEEMTGATFCVKVLGPIFIDVLKFLNCHVFQRCIILTLSACSKQDLGDDGSNLGSDHSTGFAFHHHQLGILQKGVRVFLIYMKLLVSTLERTADIKKHDLDEIIRSILKELTTLMNPTESEELKTNFDIGLDIRCNIGVGICYSMYFWKYPDKSNIQAFFLRVLHSSTNHSKEDGEPVDAVELQIQAILSLDVNKIAFCFGILNTWLEQEHDKDLYFVIGKNILDIQHGVKEAVNLGSARVMEVWADKLSRPSVPINLLEHVHSLFEPLEFFCFMYMPGHIDAVKNCCRNILSTLAKIYDRLDDEKVAVPGRSQNKNWVDDLLVSIIDKPTHIKWIALACIARNTKKVMKVLELDPCLPEKLLTVPRNCRNSANDTYIALMSYAFTNGENDKVWKRTWIDPLFESQSCFDGESNWPHKRSIISVILTSRRMNLAPIQVMIRPLLTHVVQKMNSSSDDLIKDSQAEENSSEATLLAVETIKMAHEQKISLDFENLNLSLATNTSKDSFRGLVPRSVLYEWLWSRSSQIRLAGLSLLVDTKKTSEEISDADFDSLKIFLKYNLQSQNPAFRQQFMSYFKKLVRRLKDGEAIAKRKQNGVVVQRYRNFLRWTWTFLTEKEGLFSGANFGRRCQALDCLSELTQTFADFAVFELETTGNIKYLRWLTDTYDNNKINSLEVLTRMPIIEFEDENFSNAVFKEAMSLCKSVKPPDSVTGRYLMILLIRKCSSTNPKFTSFAILESLYSELCSIFDRIGSSSLIQVATESPMYGTLRCIRMILQNTKEYKENRNVKKYREYITKLLKMCYSIDEILFPVLGSAAPEGFLPGLKDSAVEENKQVVRSLTAQMLLVCAWRSMKEVCLLMADMCSLFQIEGERAPTEYLLTFQQVSDIGGHLLHLLKNLMHRGVFEQVFVGFKQLAARLWKSSSTTLNRLPEKWLQDAMDQEHISGKSITRRSAGLPFIFQALLSAECDNEPFIQKWIQRLLIFDESPALSPVRIHSMNVLRGLFRDASFSSAMMPFVPHGLRMAFRGLKSTDWTERNSGLMLYGAVMRRSFGAKLNLMNAPTFFRKFPQMYDFLLSELDVCIMSMEARYREKKNAQFNQVSPTTCDFTFHLLLLLSSFTPSKRLEDTHFKLGGFISRIRKCGESDDMEVRKLSAKALVPFLMSPEEKQGILLNILQGIEKDISTISQNKLHGDLFQFYWIASHLDLESDQIAKDLQSTVTSEFLSWICSTRILKLFKAPAVFDTVLRILCTLNSFGCINKDVIQEQGVKLTLQKYEEQFSSILFRNFVPGLLIADKSIANSCIQIDINNTSPDSLVESVYNYFVDLSPKSTAFIEEFLALCQENGDILKTILNPEDEESCLVIVETVTQSYLKRSKEEFLKFPATEVELGYLNFLQAAPPDVLCALEENTFECLKKRLFQFCDEEERSNESTTLQIRAAAFKILGNIVFNTGIHFKEDEGIVICDMALKWSASDADDDVRLAVAQTFPMIPFPQMQKFTLLNQGKLWASIFLLAQDDETYIRRIINQKLSSNVKFCDRKSLEELMSIYFRHFFLLHSLEGFLVIFGLLQRNDLEYDIKTAADDESEDRIFDKSEMNMFFEPVTLAKIFQEQIDNFPREVSAVKKMSFGKPLPEDHLLFYSTLSNTMSNISSEDSPAYITLADISTQLLKKQVKKNKTNQQLSVRDILSMNNGAIQSVKLNF